MNDLLTIGLTGDVMLGRTLDGVIAQSGYDYPWGNVLSLVKRNDLNIINLETTLTNCTKKVYKAFNFKSTPDKIKSLLNANISIANIANNHILDFSEEGLLETIATLDKAGIKHVGAGRNTDEAQASVVINKNNITVGILGLTDNEPGWMADSRPGTNYINILSRKDREGILRAIEALRKKCDILVISIHWGPNMREEPAPDFVAFAHDMINHGANVIHGHSAHILQGIECINNNLVLYDTGDFIDDYVVDPDLRNDLSAFFILTVSKIGVVHLKVVPVRIAEYQTNQARDEDYIWVIKRLEQLSSPFGTLINEDGEIYLNAANSQS